MTTPIHRAKTRLRQEVRVRLEALTPQQRTVASREICSQLRQHAIWESAGAVLCFAPLANEPDVWPLVEEGLAAGKTIGLPRFSASCSSYVACQVRELARDIRVGQFQIREPAESCPEVAVARFDLILVPGVGFDRAGHRLGRGKAFYDRLLTNVPRDRLCGVAFEEQWLEEIPAENHDVAMRFVVMPKGLFRCGE